MGGEAGGESSFGGETGGASAGPDAVDISLGTATGGLNSDAALPATDFESAPVESNAPDEMVNRWFEDEDAGSSKLGEREREAARLAELEEQVERLRPFEPIVEHLRQNGFEDAGAVEAQLRAQFEAEHVRTVQAEQAQRRAALEGSLQQEMQKRIDTGALSPDQAAAEFGRQLYLAQREAAVQQMAATAAQQRTAAELAHAVTAYPELAGGADAVVHALHGAGMGDVPQVAALMGQILRANGERAVAEFVARQSLGTSAAPTVGSGGTPAPTEGRQSDHRSSWSRLLGLK